MELFWAIILLVVGLAILVKGADWLVDGAVAIARHFGMSPLIIGLTIVAMGTSAPEVAAGVAAALDNAADKAIGNVFGSNIANLAFIGGICALIQPINVTRAALFRDIPIMLAVSVLLYPLFHNLTLGRLECAGMLLFFTAIIIFMIRSERALVKKDRQAKEEIEDDVEQIVGHPPKTLWASSLLVLIGLVCLAVGAEITVKNATVLGKYAGMSDAVIGSTILAVGTSLPELITCLIAALKGHDDLSIGNLVGSNIFNTLLVLGIAGIAKPLVMSSRMAGLDYALMIGVSIIFSVLAFIFKKVNRPAGVVLLLLYGSYMFYLFVINR